ncbi:MAG: type II toxin-antitoxin system PemK/MazF family toxin, partial [Prevotellaceae bacterium]|nr:type II toxin-antitoxin system PemK/MazF family toxin [Prevotellaceae bacterium]
MICRQFDIWVADLNPRIGTEAGKVRPVLIIQTNLLNSLPHLSTLICPITTNITENAS